MVYFRATIVPFRQKGQPLMGGEIFKEKFSIGQYDFVALVLGAEDNMIGLHSMK